MPDSPPQAAIALVLSHGVRRRLKGGRRVGRRKAIPSAWWRPDRPPRRGRERQQDCHADHATMRIHRSSPCEMLNHRGLTAFRPVGKERSPLRPVQLSAISTFLYCASPGGANYPKAKPAPKARDARRERKSIAMDNGLAIPAPVQPHDHVPLLFPPLTDRLGNPAGGDGGAVPQDQEPDVRDGGPLRTKIFALNLPWGVVRAS